MDATPGAEPESDRSRDPLRSTLTVGGDTVDLAEWAGALPQVNGTAPHIRFGSRWFNLVWLLPIGVVLGVVGVAVCQGLRTLDSVQDFIADYPGTSTTPAPSYSGFPGWLRWQHFFNLFFMMFIMRAGIQILADHPRLYWNRHSTPDTEWFRFNKPVPKGRIWTAKDDSVRLPGWLGIPGIRHSIGLARWWHFSFDTLWLINGVIFYVLLFATGQWRRIVPTSWDVIPNAEPADEFAARARRAVERIAAAHPDQRVAVFAHGGIIGQILATATGSRAFALGGSDNAAISHLVVVGPRWILRRFNDTSHLEQELTAAAEPPT